jgi:aldose 1-epimerase
MPDTVRPVPARPSGRQVLLHFGEQEAVVTEVGATLRSYTVAGRDVIDGFAEDEMATSGRGQILAPWPNRLADGQYSFGGESYQLALSEPATRTAIHGLVRWVNWEVAEAGDAYAVMAHRLHPQPGYPFLLDLRLTYRLADHGLSVSLVATNEGERPCPFGAGAHPYLRVGQAGIDALLLQAPGATRYRTDERGLPVGQEPVDGTALDFRRSTPIGPAVLDTAFGDLQRDTGGRATVELFDGHGKGVALWLDEGYTHLMLYTGDTVADPARRRQGLAVEPMSCAPDAFRTGDGLRSIEPGQSFGAAWGLCSFG